jgi:ATP-binding cassette subfamily C (CFTR/MRP) protein 1
MNVTSGSVLIDDTDISKISINQVRGSINALSQEAFFLLGTIRDNLITANAISQPSEVLQDVLTRVGLWTKVLELGGLDAVLDAEEMLSHGERQLFCLARALLNPSRVLVLDEFTSK